MNINLSPEQEKIVKDELKSGHFQSAEEVIAKALSADRSGGQAEAVREMLGFVEKNHTSLQRAAASSGVEIVAG